MAYERVDRAIAEGNFWRAKEILQGRFAAAVFDLELFRRYGEVLLAMGDDIAAGRMLFCSGARNPEFKAAISLFLSRNSRTNPRAFLSSLPLSMRRQGHLLDFIVSEEFESGGWTEHALSQVRAAPLKLPPQPQKPLSGLERLREKMMGLVAVGLGILLILSLIVGVTTIIGFVGSYLITGEIGPRKSTCPDRASLACLRNG